MVRKKYIHAAQVGERIRQIRAERTLDEFAKELGVKNPTVYRYETDRIPDAETLVHIADLGTVSVDWLLTGKNPPSHVGDMASAYGKDRELTNIIRDVKRVWSTADDAAKQILRDVIRGLKKVTGLT